MADEAIPSTNDGIVGVKPSYQDALMDTFGELMVATEKRVQEESDKQRITGKEYATVFLGNLQNSMNIAAQMAKDEAETQYKIDHIFALDKNIKEAQLKQLKTETDLKETLDPQIKREQIRQLQAETYFKYVQAEQIIQSVYDNRQIKIIDALSNMVGMILNGGTQAVPAGLLDQLTASLNAIKATPKLNYPMIFIDAPLDLYDVSVVDGVNVYTIKTNVIIAGYVRDVAVGSTVSVHVNGSAVSTTVSANMTWSVTVSDAAIKADVNKSIYAKTSVTDSMGNVRVAIDYAGIAEAMDA